MDCEEIPRSGRGFAGTPLRLLSGDCRPWGGRWLKREQVRRLPPGRSIHFQAAPAQCARASRAFCTSREGVRDLAVLDLAGSRDGGARARLRARGARLRARRSPRHHRRQPTPPLRGDVRGAVARRDPGADVPGLGGQGARLRDGARGSARRVRRRPGAGRQAARASRFLSQARENRLRGPARHAPLRPVRARALRGAAGEGARAPPPRQRLLGRRGRQGQGKRPLHHPLHLRDHRQSQGGGAALRQCGRDGESGG